MNTPFIIIIIAFYFTSCDGHHLSRIDDDSNTETKTDKTFEISAGSCITLNNASGNDFCFSGMVKEDRCLKEHCATCFGSKATIQTKFDETRIDLDIIGCIDEAIGPAALTVDTLGYSFKLLKLDPYPDSTNTVIRFEEYKAKIQIAEND